MTDRARTIVLALQGCAALTYAIAQVSRTIPAADLARISPLDGLVRSGNLALAVLLGTYGFLLTGRLVAARQVSVWSLLRAAGAELVVPVGSVVVVCAAALALDAADGADAAVPGSTPTSVARTLTFGWNWWQRDLASAGTVRAELSALWVFSVLVQLTLVAVAAVALLGGRPRTLAVLCACAAAGGAGFRVVELAEHGWAVASLHTMVRADSFLLGMAVALAGHRLRLDPARAAAVLGGATLVLAGGLLSPTLMRVETLFQAYLPAAAALTAAVALAALHDPDPRGMATGFLGRADVARVGALWAPLVSWSPFVSIAVPRLVSPDQPALATALIAAGVVAALVVGSERVVVAVSAAVHARGRPGGRRRGERDSAQVGGEDGGAGGQPPADG